MTGPGDTRPVITVTEIGEFISHRSCERRLRLAYSNRAAARELPFADRLFNVLDPVLQAAGRDRENEWEGSLREAGYDVLVQGGPESDAATFDDFLDACEALAEDEQAYIREPAIEGELGGFHVIGRVDFCVLRWVAGRPTLRLVECKASRRDRTYQRIQVAVYGLLAKAKVAGRTISGVPLQETDVESVVARIDESTNQGQAILDLPPFGLNQEEADVRRLLSPEGPLARIINTPLEQLSYQLDAKCDSCVFDVHCFPESARLRRIELVGVEPSTRRMLQSAGVVTIDDLATLALESPEARAVRAIPGFNHSLAALRQRAHARCSTLPGAHDPDTYEVEALPNNPQSQLPAHVSHGQRIVRVYLTVHYDYVENRIGALSAHVTESAGQLHTPFVEQDGRWQPAHGVVERHKREGAVDWRDAEERPLSGHDVVAFQAAPWTGRYDEDTGTERALLQGFLHALVDAIAEVARRERAPVHFFVWSRSEIARLIEACSRVGSGLLGHLRELLGCREPLEQLIYSCLQDEVRNRYATGWTGRGLVVVSSLRWYGRRYHWRREVTGQPVDLDRLFTQDIFDFKTTLHLDPAGEWADGDAPGATSHRFEIRSRFFDTVPAPYWHAVWRTLPDPAGIPRSQAKLANAIRRYSESAAPGCFRAYLIARAHALRWVEDNIRFKNDSIEKPLLSIPELLQFDLGVDQTAAAGIDFLRLDQHVKVTDWIAQCLTPPAYRLPTGRTLPISNVRCTGQLRLAADIDLTGYDITAETLQGNCAIQEGDFLRFTPCEADRTRGQTVRQLLRLGSTCVVSQLDWDNERVILSVIPQRTSDLYHLLSYPYTRVGPVCDHATLDASQTDYVAGRVERRLQDMGGHAICEWLDPTNPQIPTQRPLAAGEVARLTDVAAATELSTRRRLVAEQVDAAIDGLNTRVQLLQGPPGTGKTTTAAIAVLTRVAARRTTGDVVLIAANTHTAVNNLLERIHEILPSFQREATARGVQLPDIRLAKVEGEQPHLPAVPLLRLRSRTRLRDIRDVTANAVAIIGGTTGALLKMASTLDGLAAFGRQPGGFQVRGLIVDEASMMVFPHFLALGTILAGDGELMLTGDHRQLAPIVAHDWEHEDRPPVVLYQPYASAFEAVRSIDETSALAAAALTTSALRYTFRLPAVIRGLIARLYRRDAIDLEGRPHEEPMEAAPDLPVWARVWEGRGGLYLVVHDERASAHSNHVEAAILDALLDNARGLGTDQVAVVTPHRAQRNLLRHELEAHSGLGHPVGVIDTVERLQGGERPVIIVSATESEPSFIASRVEFILNLNRSNVAFSRAQDRLIVVCARTLLDHVPAETDHYESTMLWKSLREYCSHEVGSGTVDGVRVTVSTPSDADVLDALAERVERID